MSKNNTEDFVIEKGILVEYTGEGGSVVIPDGVTIIGNSAFFGCMKLTSVKIPESVIRIDGSAFFGCSNLTDVVIPDSVTDIGNSAFFDCGLIRVSIPASVTNIGESAFGYCQSLTSITVDKNNVNYRDIDGNLYSKDGKTFIQYAAGKTETEFMVPYGVAVVGVSAFEGCKSLTNVETPESVERIVDGAFSQCESLTEVSIRGPKTDISFFAFDGRDDVIIMQAVDSDESCVMENQVEIELGGKDMIERGDVFYADLSPVLGAREGILRPVLIVQTDVGMRNSPTVIAVEITSEIPQTLLSTQVKIGASESGLSNDFVILLERMRTVDILRLKEKIGHLDKQIMQNVVAAISEIFGLG